MSDGLDELPCDVQALLRAERTRVGLPEEARSHLAERLAVTVPGFGPPHVPAAITGAPPSGAGALASAMAKVLLALALGAGGAATLGAIDAHAPPRASSHSATVVARELAPHAGRVVVDKPDVRVVAPIAPAPVAPPPPTTASASLREERRLLDAARDAIVRGDPGDALGPTAAHAARFPRGLLAEERDALRIRAFARLGRADDARALLARMREDHPRSFLLAGATADVEAIR